MFGSKNPPKNDLSRRMAKAKAQLVIEQPFIASLLFNVPLVERDTIPTLAVDGQNIYYNPQFMEGLSHLNIQWALAHEVYHLVFKHILLRGHRDPGKWNRAGDYVINQILEEHAGQLSKGRIEGVLYDPDLYRRGGGTTIGIYNLLPDDPPSGGGGLPGNQGKGGAFDEVMDMPGDEAEKSRQDAIWSVRVNQAVNAAKIAGRLPSGIERILGEVQAATIPWQDKLRRFCLKPMRSERSFARPSRRHLHAGLVLPGSSGYGMGDILVAVDWSGSVTKEQLDSFAAEMRGIKEDAKPENMHMVYFTSRVTKYKCFSRDDELHMENGPTGGTAFSPIFRYAEDHNINPDCCVVLTDLHCNDFGPQPDYPVMWISNGAQQAPWGEVTKLEG